MRVTIPEPSLVLLVGPSGSGENAFAARHFRPTEVLSLDAVRRLVADDDTDEGATEAAWGALLELAARRVGLGRLTVIDADMTSASRRQPLLEMAADHHFITVAFLFGGDIDGDGSGIRHVFRLPSGVNAASVRVRRMPLWSNRKDDAGPFDIVGSVHGRYEELVDLLDKLGYGTGAEMAHPRGRRLVFLGDLVDHGPRNADVLRLVMRAVDAGVAYSIPGNHDARLVRWLRGEATTTDGGMAETIDELNAASAEFRAQVETFLDSSVSHYVFDKGNLVVAHAGLTESLQGRGSAAVREFALHGEAPGESEESGPDSTPRWVLDYQGAARVVYSHPSVSEPLWLNQTVNLGVRGRLAALRYPEMRIVRTPAAVQEQAALAIE